MTLKRIGHSVGQRFTVPSAVQGHERLHSSMYNRAGVFLFHDFRKRTGAATILGVAPRANNLYQRAWARGQIDAAGPRLYPAIYPGARNPENNSEAVNLFLI